MARVSPSSFVCKTGETARVRSVEIDEAMAMVAFLQQAAATTDQILTSPDEVVTLEQEPQILRDTLVHPRNINIAAFVDGQIVGSIVVRTVDRRRGWHVGEIGMMCLADWRGRGVGRGLLNAAIVYAREHQDLMKLSLGVFDTNTSARYLYESVGFVVEGVRERQGRTFGDHDSVRYHNEIVMGLWLGD